MTEYNTIIFPVRLYFKDFSQLHKYNIICYSYKWGGGVSPHTYEIEYSINKIN